MFIAVKRYFWILVCTTLAVLSNKCSAIGFMTQPGGVSATNTITFSNKTINCGQNGDVCNFGGATLDGRSGTSSTIVTTTGASTTNESLTTPSIYNALSFGIGEATNANWIIAATGTTYGASTFLNHTVNFVTSADASNIAVAFPSSLVNAEIIYVSNTSSRAISVFPSPSRTVTDQNGITGSAGAAYSLAAGETIGFISRTGVSDYRVLMAPTLSSSGTTGTGAVVKAASPTLSGTASLTNATASGIIASTKEATGTTSLLFNSGFIVGNGGGTEACVAFNAGDGSTYNWALCQNYVANEFALVRSGAVGGSNLTQNRWKIDGSGNETIPGRVNTTGVAYTAANPTISSCGTSPSVDSNSSNYAGTITVGTVAASGCTITFAAAFGTYNHCVVTSQQSVTAFAYSYTLSAITVTATSMISDKIDYHCEGY